MTKVYIITGCDYNTTEVYTNKETAEKEAEKINYGLSMSGSWNKVSVEEVNLIED